MERMLGVADKLSDVELTRIKRETADQIAQIRENYGHKGLPQSSSVVDAVKRALEDELNKRVEALTKTIHGLLENAPRKYYSKSEIALATNWAKGQFSSAGGELVHFLKEQAEQAAQASSSTFSRQLKEFEGSIDTARARLRAELESEFVARDDWFRWFAERGKHPAAVAGLLVLSFFFRPLLIEISNRFVNLFFGNSEQAAIRTWSIGIEDVHFAEHLRSDQSFVFNVNGSMLSQRVAVEARTDHYEGPELATRTEEGVVIRLELRSADDAVLLEGTAFPSRNDLIQPNDFEATVLMVPTGSKVPEGFEDYFTVPRTVIAGAGAVQMPGSRVYAAPIRLILKPQDKNR